MRPALFSICSCSPASAAVSSIGSGAWAGPAFRTSPWRRISERIRPISSSRTCASTPSPGARRWRPGAPSACGPNAGLRPDIPALDARSRAAGDGDQAPTGQHLRSILQVGAPSG